MILRRIILSLLAVGLSIASTCPFAAITKQNPDTGIPELDHNRLDEVLAKIKQHSPDGELPFDKDRILAYHAAHKDEHYSPHKDAERRIDL